MFSLTGRRALVTGSSRGIGQAIALALAGQGADVVVHYHTRKEAAEHTAGLIRGLGQRSLVLGADAADTAALVNLWKQSEDQLGPLDILVNNAGLMKSSFLTMTSESSWDEIMQVNLKAAFVLTKQAARAMSRRKYGRIVNISSQAGQMGDVMRASYAAAKAGLIGLTKATARELAQQGVTCNAIAPGLIETEILQSGGDRRLEAQRMLIPLGRFGRPEEVAAMAVFLASQEASYVTGQCLPVDGGLRM